MAYLQDFYPLDIDDSYIEYVISELKYDDNDILLLDVDKIVNTAKRFRLTVRKMAEITRMAQWWKPFKIKIMAYLQDFYPLDIDDSYIEYVISELKYDDNDFIIERDKIAKRRTMMIANLGENCDESVSKLK